MFRRIRNATRHEPLRPEDLALAERLRSRSETVKMAALARSYGLRQLEPKRPFGTH